VYLTHSQHTHNYIYLWMCVVISYDLNIFNIYRKCKNCFGSDIEFLLITFFLEWINGDFYCMFQVNVLIATSYNTAWHLSSPGSTIQRLYQM
jgi:hypothetical protein